MGRRRGGVIPDGSSGGGCLVWIFIFVLVFTVLQRSHDKPYWLTKDYVVQIDNVDKWYRIHKVGVSDDTLNYVDIYVDNEVRRATSSRITAAQPFILIERPHEHHFKDHRKSSKSGVSFIR